MTMMNYKDPLYLSLSVVTGMSLVMGIEHMSLFWFAMTLLCGYLRMKQIDKLRGLAVGGATHGK